MGTFNIDREALIYSILGFTFGILLVRFGISKTIIITLFTIFPYIYIKGKKS